MAANPSAGCLMSKWRKPDPSLPGSSLVTGLPEALLPLCAYEPEAMHSRTLLPRGKAEVWGRAIPGWSLGTRANEEFPQAERRDNRRSSRFAEY